MSNIEFHNGRANYLSSVDFYRRVPKDLTEATTLGATMSIVALCIMGTLFVLETFAFMSSELVTSIALDENAAQQLKINFNITFHELHCDYVSVDIWDSLGTHKLNITKNVEKWQLDEKGTRRIFSGRNREVRQVKHDYEHHLIPKPIHDNGDHVTLLDDDSYDDFLKDNPMAFINFYAPWCVWCQRLHPTWEVFAEDAEKKDMPIRVASVNCVEHGRLCQRARVMAFPTIRWFNDAKPSSPDYKQDRTVEALTNYAERKIQLNEKFKDWNEKNDNNDNNSNNSNNNNNKMLTGRPEHPACQISGHLMVNRVPGNFHVEARSNNHNLNAAMTNLTHTVNHLSFGDNFDFMRQRKTQRILKQVPSEYKQFHPLDDNLYSSNKYHEAYHHYIKVVSTNIDFGSKNSKIMAYQFLETSQIVYYKESDVPEARFSYDISPMMVVIQKDGRKWYDYLTSLCAIIGGSFTTLGLIDASLYKALKTKKM